MFYFLFSMILFSYISASTGEEVKSIVHLQKKWEKLLNKKENFKLKQVLEEAFSEGTSIFDRYPHGGTLLTSAIYNKNVEMTKFFLDKKFDLSLPPQLGGKKSTFLHEAVKTGCLEIVTLLVNEKIDLVNEIDENEQTALHLVSKRFCPKKPCSISSSETEPEKSYKAYFEIFKFLLEKGAGINARDFKSRTPFHLACKTCFSENIIKHFIENGAELRAKDQFEQTALHKAAKRKLHRSAKRMRPYLQQITLDIITLLVEENIEIDAQDAWGRTPFHFACKNGSLSVIEYLLEKGANIHHKDHFGQTVLHKTTANSLLLEYLILKGIDINGKDNEGNTPLHVAALKDHSKAVYELRKNNADILILNNKGEKPSDIAPPSSYTYNALKISEIWDVSPARALVHAFCILQ